jgi:hypothetical protein
MVAVAASYEEGDGGGGIEEGSGGATGEGRREMQTRVNGKGCEKERDVERANLPSTVEPRKRAECFEPANACMCGPLTVKGTHARGAQTKKQPMRSCK